MENGSNSSSYTEFKIYAIPRDLQLLFAVAYYTISIVSVLGNVLIIYVVAKNKRMHNMTNYFITNLAFVDIIISVFSTPFQVIIALG
jgi:hypothetical protein